MSYSSWISNEPKSQKPCCCYLKFFKISHLHSDIHSQMYSVEESEMWTKLLMPATLSLAKFSWQLFWCVRWWWYTWWWWFYDDDNDDGDFCADAEGIKCWWWEMWDNLERLKPTQLDIFGHLWTSLDISTPWGSDRKQPGSFQKSIIKINQGWIDLRISSSYYIYIAQPHPTTGQWTYLAA